MFNYRITANGKILQEGTTFHESTLTTMNRLQRHAKQNFDLNSFDSLTYEVWRAS